MLDLLRSLGALLTVLGLLAGALWAVRRFNLVLPGSGDHSVRRLAVIERLGLDPRRSLALVRRDDVEHLVLLAPEGHLVIETRIIGMAAVVVSPASAENGPTAIAPVMRPVVAGAVIARLGQDFATLVERARRSISPPSAKPSAVPRAATGTPAARAATGNRRRKRHHA